MKGRLSRRGHHPPPPRENSRKREDDVGKRSGLMAYLTPWTSIVRTDNAVHLSLATTANLGGWKGNRRGGRCGSEDGTVKFWFGSAQSSLVWSGLTLPSRVSRFPDSPPGVPVIERENPYSKARNRKRKGTGPNTELMVRGPYVRMGEPVRRRDPLDPPMLVNPISHATTRSFLVLVIRPSRPKRGRQYLQRGGPRERDRLLRGVWFLDSIPLNPLGPVLESWDVWSYQCLWKLTGIRVKVSSAKTRNRQDDLSHPANFANQGTKTAAMQRRGVAPNAARQSVTAPPVVPAISSGLVSRESGACLGAPGILWPKLRCHTRVADSKLNLLSCLSFWITVCDDQTVLTATSIPKLDPVNRTRTTGSLNILLGQGDLHLSSNFIAVIHSFKKFRWILLHRWLSAPLFVANDSSTIAMILAWEHMRHIRNSRPACGYQDVRIQFAEVVCQDPWHALVLHVFVDSSEALGADIHLPATRVDYGTGKTTPADNQRYDILRLIDCIDLNGTLSKAKPRAMRQIFARVSNLLVED
ncbi:uncharacterized protein CLUP02_17007 [Colletotrichum lupini]|uniref:Uncharacterized protein n=1 Tax=Colletotrichum lupini TaxID=145971 RepID=A0A9Q8TAV9_9PEZI|nr:uncharacterized protein CLUP02_17007 [Colletotrichum lupini]UQC91472.1 hypothetical protein CLUP02_17007 [Colletotrichum lupini]